MSGGHRKAGSHGHYTRAKNEIILRPSDPAGRPVLITGGAGFIGTNVAHRYLSAGEPVIVYDNLARPGVERNLEWLKATHGDLVQIQIADVRHAAALRVAVRRASKVFHFAAQVAVTTSLDDPASDFEVNARGTLNLLEAIRALDNPPPLIFTSTNKVYGNLEGVAFRRKGERYEPANESIAQHGFSEDRCLQFHSPYGCSKGAADQYVLDYARTFKLPAIVFRMSCVYGWHQLGNEDQGWVAHFLIRAKGCEPITIYGDGRQVRDVLFIEDLVDAFQLAQARMDALTGSVFNIGGGPDNTTSLLELMGRIRELHGTVPRMQFAEWRPADQLYYVSDIRKFSQTTGWRPKVGVRQGLAKLYEWLQCPEFTGRELNDAGKGNVHANGHTAARTTLHRRSVPSDYSRPNGKRLPGSRQCRMSR